MLGPIKGYTDLLNEATQAKSQAEVDAGKKFQKTPIRPSSSGECARALYYQLMEFSGRAKYPTTANKPELTRLFALGHSVEYHLLKQFEVLSNLFEIRYKQQVLSFRYLKAEKDEKLSQWFEGSLDMVFWSEKHKCVADVKSKKDKFNVAFKSGWDETTEKLQRMKSVKTISETAFWVDDLEAFLVELNDPFFEPNFKQLNMYACSDFLVERGIDHGAIIQYNKNDSRVREVRFRPSRKLYEATITKMQGVINAVDLDKPELAPKEHMLGSVKCHFCNYKTTCWPGVDASKAFYNTLPPKQWPKDTDRLGEAGKEIELLFRAHEQQDIAEKAKKITEENILKIMMNKGLSRIRLENGEVYEAKKLTNAIVLRKTK